jgi:hypothetical protein
MAQPSKQKLIIALTACLFILCASHTAHAQIGWGNLTLNIDNTDVSNGFSNETGSTVAPGTLLSGSVTVNGVTGNQGTTTVYCYASGTPILSWSTSVSATKDFTWTPTAANTTYDLYCTATWSGLHVNGTVETPYLYVPTN